MRYTKHHKTAEVARLPRALLVGGASIIVLAAAAVFLTGSPPSARKALPAFSLPGPNTVFNTPAEAADKPVRLVYRNSVVPGGVHSAAELAAVIARDPIAAAHYANFDVSKAHLIRVEKSRLAHVSYRIGNQIFWTKNKVRLAEGEALLSDGTHLIRARCGNMLADEAQAPVLLKEPAPEVLETAFVSAEDLIDQAINAGEMGGAPPPAPLPTTPAASPGDTPAPLRALAFAGLAQGSGAIGTVSGVTVLPARAPAAAPVQDPAVDPGAPAAPAVGKGNIPDAPTGDPVAPLLPGATPGKGGINDPIEVGSDQPTKDTPEGPFIEPPVFTPPAALPAAPATAAKAPEPGSAALAVLALLLLVCLRRPRVLRR
jgi:hypothetical protein